ncbi:histidine phosphatase family protein [Rhodopirellula sp. JC740]|uniref:Histidine phosphatase family protein n=1 Tax=Rhodopirellula halodulae TaxID=2894198 RepID=A0ABS8NK79_9BACT|nr:histidine phosphatase family protein [Rhodopirellula sp. JC740]MCC9643949.1 histidine phosphatase family protein [Rhodopirellula sp. JC740]
MRLILMRHAKSDWADASLDDHDRPLNARGRRDAPRMAGWMEENGCRPDFVLSSDSKRTRETFSFLEARWGQSVPVHFSSKLYLASAPRIREIIQSTSEWLSGDQDESIQMPETLLVLGHNPGISTAASELLGHACGLPTAALVIWTCQIDSWARELTLSNCKLLDSMRPKQLP